jgi:hypothetical protein
VAWEVEGGQVRAGSTAFWITNSLPSFADGGSIRGFPNSGNAQHALCITFDPLSAVGTEIRQLSQSLNDGDESINGVTVNNQLDAVAIHLIARSVVAQSCFGSSVKTPMDIRIPYMNKLWRRSPCKGAAKHIWLPSELQPPPQQVTEHTLWTTIAFTSIITAVPPTSMAPFVIFSKVHGSVADLWYEVVIPSLSGIGNSALNKQQLGSLLFPLAAAPIMRLWKVQTWVKSETPGTYSHHLSDFDHARTILIHSLYFRWWV